MSAPNPEEVNAMKNLLAIMNGEKPTPRAGNTSSYSSTMDEPLICAPGHVSSKDIGAMKGILERLNAAGSGAATRLNEEANYDSDVREALQTRRTSTGAKIGSWEIRVQLEERNGKEYKSYDVVNTTSGEPIAKMLTLYEVAHGLAKLFNRGETLTTPKVRELLALEETYTRNRIDALRFKKRYTDSTAKRDYEQAEIFEARYQASRGHALSAKSKISGLYESL